MKVESLVIKVKWIIKCTYSNDVFLFTVWANNSDAAKSKAWSILQEKGYRAFPEFSFIF